MDCGLKLYKEAKYLFASMLAHTEAGHGDSGNG